MFVEKVILMKYFGILLILFSCLSASAQTTSRNTFRNIKGTVYDIQTKEIIPSASVQLKLQSDSTIEHTMLTNKDGKFSFSLKPNKYILEISFLGFKKHSEIINTSELKEDLIIEDIYLEEDTIMLNAAIIEADVPDIVVKGDTIQYNAGAFKTEDHELLQDLVKKIPGIEIDSDGTIKANGKPITKILVDGKEFFGSDIAYALNNLPANMITKLQLFKEQSEEAKATGVKDQDPPQVLNLVIKEEFKKSVFGDVKAGYGTDNRYISKLNANRMYGDNNYSVIANASNVNEGDIRYMGFGGNGINTNKDAGTNFNIVPSDKIKINGSMDYARSKNTSESRNESYTSLVDRYTKGSNNSLSRGESISPKVSVDWKPDSLTTIFFRTNMRINKDDNIYNSSDSSLLVTEQKPTIGFSTSSSNNNSNNFDASLMLVRRLNKEGRSVRLNIDGRLGNGKEKGSNYSQTIYTDKDPNIIDNISATDSKNNSYGFTVGYVEPLGKDNKLQLSYSFNKNKSDREKDARKKDINGNYTIIDSVYSRNTESDFIRHNINVNFQSSKEKFDYSIGFNIDPSRSKNKVALGDSIIEDLRQNVVNFSPSFRIAYKPKESTQMELYYSGSTQQPDLRQLSADTVVYNGLSKFVGNPNLKPSYDNRVQINFMRSNIETKRFFNISGSVNYRFNDIVSYTLIDEDGNRMQTYRNVSGNMNAYIYANYNTPLKNKKLQLSLFSNANYRKNISYTNDQEAISENTGFGQGGNLRFNSEKIETSMGSMFYLNLSENNLADKKHSTTSRYSISNDFKIKLPFDFQIRNNISYSYMWGYGEGAKKSELLWNASIEKLFLKKKMGTLQLQLVDILNDRTKEFRNISGNDYSYYWNNSITNYILLTFSYRFQITKGANSKPKSNEHELDEYYY